MRGGLVFYRGTGAAARAYVESDHSHADEYYLEDESIRAQWSAFDADGSVIVHASLEGERYQAWVDWRDPFTGEVRGFARDEVRVTKEGEVVTRPASPRFVEMTVNCDKSLSVAAALVPEVSEALDAAQARAVDAMGVYLARNSVTRVGPRGAQKMVSVGRLEQVAVKHRTSRAGDPHRHVHVQWSTRVKVAGKWRGLWTAPTLKQQAVLRGVGEAVIASDVGLRDALRRAGLTFDAGSGAVPELADHAALLSKRSAQIQQNKDAFERAWWQKNPGVEPSKDVVREWDQQAWARGRPQKADTAGAGPARWIGELEAAGLAVDGFTPSVVEKRADVGDVDRAEVVLRAVGALEERQSAWSVADLEGAVAVQVAKTGLVASSEETTRLVSEITHGTVDSLVRLEIDYDGQVPDWVRWLTSERVLGVEQALRDGFAQRGMDSVLVTDQPVIGTLTQTQSDAARALGGTAPLVVVEGAAGTGKTTMLAEAKTLAEEDGRRLLVVAPTLRAAQEAGNSIGAAASSAHKLIYEYGFRQDPFGRWERLHVGDVDPYDWSTYTGPRAQFRVDAGTRIVVDEAGMIDQDIAHAVLQVADETGASVGLVGDRAQLPAVGRGGVLDMAVHAHPTPLDLTDVHRFGADTEYAALSLQMRDRAEPEELFQRLLDRGNIRIHDTEHDAHTVITEDALRHARAGESIAVATATNAEADTLNTLIHQARAETGHTRPSRHEVTGSDHIPLRVGDRIMTRDNNPRLHVANRDTWDVKKIHRDLSLTITNHTRTVRIPHEYVTKHTHLAYASTEYGVQGATVTTGHGIVTDSSTANAVYVAATRGRTHNTLHIIAPTTEHAKETFTHAINREGGDRGLETARHNANQDLHGITTETPNPKNVNTQNPKNVEDGVLRDGKGRVIDQAEIDHFKSIGIDIEQAIKDMKNQPEKPQNFTDDHTLRNTHGRGRSR